MNTVFRASFVSAIILVFLILQLTQCQYVRRGNFNFHNPYKTGYRYPNNFEFKSNIHNNNDDNHRHHEYNTYRDFNNDFKLNKNSDEYDKGGEEPVHYYYDRKPIKPIEFRDHWTTIKPIVIRKEWPTLKPIETEQFAVDYTEDEYKEPETDSLSKGLLLPNVNYDNIDEEHHEKDHKEGAVNKYSGIDKHLDSGYKKAEFSKIGGNHDKHLDARKESEHQNFKKDGEYSHDRGHGFIKSWSWDRKHVKGNVEGQKSKDSAEITAGEKGAFGAVAGKASEAHDKKGLTALAGGSAYGKASHENSGRKTKAGGSAADIDYEKEFPIFG